MMLKPQLYIYLIHALRSVFLIPIIKGLNFLIDQEDNRDNSSIYIFRRFKSRLRVIVYSKWGS